jgi:peptidoglycan/xylan/chitin deacetylase (PgdA/CDA1 family)
MIVLPRRYALCMSRAGDATWALRSRLGPGARRRSRRLADLALAPLVGSWNSSRARDSVALTFDDGPDPAVTPALIDRLAEMNVRATFFLLVLRAERYPRLVERLVAADHEIALHGLDHRRVTELPHREVRHYLSSARERLEQVAGLPVTMFRPPYGAQSLTSYRAARHAGMEVVVWNGDAADWRDRPAADVARAAVDASRPGGVLLFHERLEPDPRRGAPETTFDRVTVVGELVEGVRARGLSPCAVGDLAARARMVRTAWFRP